jgi:hypothetical protein
MAPDEIEKLFDRTLELNLADSLFENDLESYQVSGVLKSNPCQGFDLELLKPLFSGQREAVGEQSTENFSHGDGLYLVIDSQENRRIEIKGFVNDDWIYKEDKYILQKNVTSFFIKNNILSEDVQQSYTISFYLDKKQISPKQELILRNIRSSENLIEMDLRHNKFVRVTFKEDENYLTEEFSEKLFKILRFILNCRKYDIKRITFQSQYTEKIDGLNYSDNPNGVYIPVDVNQADVLNLFLKLKIYMRSSNGDFLERILNYLFTGSGLPLELQALVYCIIIEESSRKIEPTLNMSKTEEYLELLDKFKSVEKAIEDLNLGTDFSKRFTGAVAIVKNISPKNILNSLKDKGLLNEVDVNAFNKMRNKLAHNTADYNNGIELGYTDVIKLKVLVHKMIFILINYQGSYINYNLPNYPNENLRSIL